jgi:hypothetical protein
MIVIFRNPNFAPIVESAELPTAGVREQRGLRPLFQISAYDADQIIRSFFGRLAVSRHMVADVVFHEFGHQAVDGSPGCREPLQDFCTLFIII